ncbi:MAG: TolC family protein [Rikenellaceae bacterium]
MYIDIKRAVAVVALIFASVVGASAQQSPLIEVSAPAEEVETKLYSLQECIMIGIENNFDIKISKKSEEISSRNATWGNAGLIPVVEAELSTDGDLAHGGDFSQDADASITLSWTIFDGFQTQASYARLKELEAMGELQTRMAIETLVSNIASTYYSVVRQIIRQANLKYAVELSQERFKIVQAHSELGSASILEYKQAQVDYNADYSAYIKQGEELYDYQVQLNELISKSSVDAPIKLRDKDMEFFEMEHRDAIWGSAMESNSYYLAAKYDRSISYQELRIAKAASYPSLTFSGSYGHGSSWYNPVPMNRSDDLSFSYGLTLSIPIFNAGNNARERRNAQSSLDIAELQIDAMELSLKSDLAQLWMSYNNNHSMIDLEQANVTVAREYFEAAIESYKLGMLAGIELREAQTSLLAAEEALSIARYDTKISEISLLLLSGTIIDRLVD